VCSTSADASTACTSTGNNRDRPQCIEERQHRGGSTCTRHVHGHVDVTLPLHETWYYNNVSHVVCERAWLAEGMLQNAVQPWPCHVAASCCCLMSCITHACSMSVSIACRAYRGMAQQDSDVAYHINDDGLALHGERTAAALNGSPKAVQW
jgi:hypothetical protein